MLQIVRSEYGKEINAFEFDYLGGHESLEGIILNATVKIFENGLFIGTGLKSGHAYLKWDEIIDICYLYGKRETLEIRYSKGKILLEKAKREVNIEEFLASAREAMPDVSIVTKACSQNEIYDYGISEKRLAEFDMQDKRIEKILADADEDDEIVIMETWMRYLEEHFEFPFEAEINEPQDGGFLKMGDRLNVDGIKDCDDFYGTIVRVTYKGGKYPFPLCDLEAVDRDSQNFTLVGDYSMWFASR